MNDLYRKTLDILDNIHNDEWCEYCHGDVFDGKTSHTEGCELEQCRHGLRALILEDRAVGEYEDGMPFSSDWISDGESVILRRHLKPAFWVSTRPRDESYTKAVEKIMAQTLATTRTGVVQDVDFSEFQHIRCADGTRYRVGRSYLRLRRYLNHDAQEYILDGDVARVVFLLAGEIVGMAAGYFGDLIPETDDTQYHPAVPVPEVTP